MALAYPSCRKVSAAALPEAPPPMMTIEAGRWAAASVGGTAAGSGSHTNAMPSRCSTRHRGKPFSAGGRKAAPVRRLKHA